MPRIPWTGLLAPVLLPPGRGVAVDLGTAVTTRVFVGAARVRVGEGTVVEVAVGTGGTGVGVGSAAAVKSTSSQFADAPPNGRSISLTLADRAPAGARTEPVERNVHTPLPLTAESTWLNAERLPSLDAYQLTLMKSSAAPLSTFAQPSAAYHSPPVTVTVWKSHFVDAVVER